jgi:adenine phosphoribosyltransferase
MAATRKRTAGKNLKPVPPRRGPTPRGVEAKPSLPARGRRKRAGDAGGGELDAVAYASAFVRDVKDFPKPGIVFKDITPLLADPRAFQGIIDTFAQRFVGERIDAVLAIESRGFIFGAPLAARLNAAFVPVRKAGKLPYATDRVSYALEYGTAEVEVHTDALRRGARVIIVDDLMATGGTAAAARELAKRQGAQVVAFAFVIELEFLGGRKLLEPTPLVSLIKF